MSSKLNVPDPKDRLKIPDFIFQFYCPGKSEKRRKAATALSHKILYASKSASMSHNPKWRLSDGAISDSKFEREGLPA